MAVHGELCYDAEKFDQFGQSGPFAQKGLLDSIFLHIHRNRLTSAFTNHTSCCIIASKAGGYLGAIRKNGKDGTERMNEVEKKVLEQYRRKPELQRAIHILLGADAGNKS